MKYLILFFFTFLIGLAYSQSSKTADEFYSAGYYVEAITIYEQIMAESAGADQSVKLKLADSYYKNKSYESSLGLFNELYQTNKKDSLILLRLFELNRVFEEYDKADKKLREYVDFVNKTNQKKLSYEKISKEKISYPQENSSSDQTIELVKFEDNRLVAGFGYDFLKNGDLLATKLLEDKESKTLFTRLGIFPRNVGSNDFVSIDVNEQTKLYQAYPNFDAKNNVVYFTANSQKRMRSFRKAKNVLHIYSVQLGESTSSPEELSFNIEGYDFAHPFYSPLEKRLYFSSNMPGGQGGYDLYYVNKESFGWGDPVNLGALINSSEDELTPSVSNNELYFSSYGHENFGGSDVFYSKIKENSFSAPKNMGKPINSSKDDFSFLNSDRGEIILITSNRNTSGSTDQIFTVELSAATFVLKDEVTKEGIGDVLISFRDQELKSEETGEWSSKFRTSENYEITFDNPYYATKSIVMDNFSSDDLTTLKEIMLSPIMISGKVEDQITGNPIEGADVTLYVQNDNGDWLEIESKKSDEQGNWDFHIRKDKKYKVKISKDNYLDYEEIFERLDESEDEHNAALARVNPLTLNYKVEKDLVIEINNIYFDYNSAKVKKESFAILDKVEKLLNENPDIKIELSAHTDCMGSDSYNLELSQRRAENSKSYLIKAGISSSRIKAKGYGEQKMIVTDCELQKKDDNEAQKNRRVEVKIL